MKPNPLFLIGCAVVCAALPAAEVPRAELRSLGAAAETELRGDILPWWLKYARDRDRGGFHAFIGEDMAVRDDLPRGSLLTCRVLWTFSAAYRRYGDPQYLEMARWAYRDLGERFLDRENGGLYWTVSPDGRPLDAHKQVYVQAFGIYALSEYFAATGEHEALDRAVGLYRLIDSRARDAEHGGYFDALTREWGRQAGGARNLLGDAPKSQNSHIHILEAFTNLMRVWPDEGLRRRQRELIELTLQRIIDPSTHHLVLFMDEAWAPAGDAVSYGHDIELSWLVVEASEVLGDPALIRRSRQEAVRIAEVTRSQGVDTDGGVYMEGDPRGPTDTRKEWWEQAEAAVGFVNAYQISGDPSYFAAAMRSWSFIQGKLVDRAHGDWHNMLARDGTVILEVRGRSGAAFPEAKQSLWKCPYHNSRACMELATRMADLAGGGPR